MFQGFQLGFLLVIAMVLAIIVYIVFPMIVSLIVTMLFKNKTSGILISIIVTTIPVFLFIYFDDYITLPILNLVFSLFKDNEIYRLLIYIIPILITSVIWTIIFNKHKQLKMKVSKFNLASLNNKLTNGYVKIMKVSAIASTCILILIVISFIFSSYSLHKLNSIIPPIWLHYIPNLIVLPLFGLVTVGLYQNNLIANIFMLIVSVLHFTFYLFLLILLPENSVSFYFYISMDVVLILLFYQSTVANYRFNKYVIEVVPEIRTGC